MEKHIIKTRKLTFNNSAKQPQCLHGEFHSSQPVISPLSTDLSEICCVTRY